MCCVRVCVRVWFVCVAAKVYCLDRGGRSEVPAALWPTRLCGVQCRRHLVGQGRPDRHQEVRGRHRAQDSMIPFAMVVHADSLDLACADSTSCMKSTCGAATTWCGPCFRTSGSRSRAASSSSLRPSTRASSGERYMRTRTAFQHSSRIARSDTCNPAYGGWRRWPTR